MFSWLYNKFPRQMGFPKRITVTSEEEMKYYINRYNGKVRIFASVYNYTPEDEHLVVLDKVFFDFDGENAFEDMKKLVTYLLENKYYFTFFLSGGGYHVYLFLDTNVQVINRKNCLANIQHFFQLECGVEIDKAVIGDIARVATVPNTFNNKRKKFCIPLLDEDIESSHDILVAQAELQQDYLYIYGSKKFDPTDFDTPMEIMTHSEKCHENMYSGICVVTDDTLEAMNLHPCINTMLACGNQVHLGFRGRFHLITYLRDIGMIPMQIEEIIKKYLTNIHDGKEEWKHCMKKNQIAYLWERDQYGFSKCEIIKKDGYCPIEDDYCDQCTCYGGYHKADIYL